MHQNCQEAKEETIRMINKQIEQAQMKAEVHRMNLNSQVHEMCSLIESLQKMQRKFEKGHDGRLKQLEVKFAEFRLDGLGEMVAASEQRLSGLVTGVKKEIGQKLESMKRRQSQLTGMIETSLDKEAN